jgi:hypothetical protein
LGQLDAADVGLAQVGCSCDLRLSDSGAQSSPAQLRGKELVHVLGVQPAPCTNSLTGWHAPHRSGRRFDAAYAR